MHELKEAARGLKSLLVGLKITGREFGRSQVTVHFPRQVVDDILTFRGHVELVGKPKDPATPKCISCMMCVSVCPSGCLALKKAPKPKPPPEPEGETGAEDAMVKPKEKKEPPKASKTPVKFTYNYNLCSLCGLCVQSCPVKSLRFSTDIYIASPDRETFHYDLLARLKDQAERVGEEASAKAKKPGKPKSEAERATEPGGVKAETTIEPQGGES
ncbi:4Fe-4S binding protein [Desulfohalovibrio reitneri]|uniref:4Fe-4S binding protein n=1 Tax=Desulfohalovibrio reitneri TaxID=1307759 RepID=UPI001F29FA92|nr:4Fe-4S binding protein [Desulfohalovibrio reitneri]